MKKINFVSPMKKISSSLVKITFQFLSVPNGEFITKRKKVDIAELKISQKLSLNRLNRKMHVSNHRVCSKKGII